MKSEKQELSQPVEWLKTEKISDDMYALGPNVVLRFNVHLARTTNNNRYHFHKEFEYSSKANGFESLVTIKRTFDFYLSLENCQKDSNGNKVFIRIGPAEYINFKTALETAISWFRDEYYETLFVYDSGKLIMTQPIPEYIVSNLPMNKYIKFEPVIIDKGLANADKEPGIRIELSDDSSYVDITLDKFMGLYYLVSNLNMYQAAITVVNYLGRPPFGTSRITMEGAGRTLPKLDSKTGVSGAVNGRKIPAEVKNDISSLE